MTNRILVICGDQYHPASDVMAGLEAVGRGEFVFEQAPYGPLDKVMGEFSAVVLAKLNVSSPEDSTPWATPESNDWLETRVVSGTGLLVVHAGTVGYGRDSKIRRILGGSFLHHPDACNVTVESEQANFALHDEHYFVEVDDDVNIFLHTKSDHGTQPGGWLKKNGNGQVCVITPGHFSAVWQHTEFQMLIRFGLEHVCG